MTTMEWINTGFVVLTLLCIAFVLLGIKGTYTKMGFPLEKTRKRLARIEAVLAVWLVVVSFLASKGVLSLFAAVPPPMAFVLLAPLVTVFILLFHPKIKSFILHSPVAAMMYLQAFRLPVEILLWALYKNHHVPIQMTFEGRNWDILTGITGPIFAYICFGGGRNLKSLAIVWNIAGLLLLVNIVAIAILSMPTPFRVFLNEPSNTIVATFPVVFLPAVLVPLAYYLHFFSLRKLLAK